MTTPTLTYVYERQQAVREARELASERFEEIYWDLPISKRSTDAVNHHPDVIALRKRADEIAAEVTRLREQVGGKVYRVVTSKLADLRKRIDGLNKKAKKLGTEPVTLVVSDEIDQEVRKVRVAPDNAVDWSLEQIEGTHQYREEVVDYTFVTVSGEAPMIPGWVFVATLDHEVQSSEDDSVGIRRIPVTSRLRERIGEEAATAVENADLTEYRHAPNKCDHCHTIRRRNQTYLLFELATGKLRQVGTDCVKDYTGANNPERIAAWAEWLYSLDTDLEYEGEGGFGFAEEGMGRALVSTREYLAAVSALIRKRGWVPRWQHDEYTGDFYRNDYSTADGAHSLLNSAVLQKETPITDEDYAEAEATLEWVRSDVAERELGGEDEYLYNLVTYMRGNYLGPKGDGFVASSIMARRREIERKLAGERSKSSEWFGEEKKRIKGLTIEVTFTRDFEGFYGVRTLTKGYTPEGNLILWWGNGSMEQGHTYRCNATVKKHSTDSYDNDAKVTEITNVRNVEEVD